MGAKTRKLSQINDSLIEWQSVVVADGSTGLTAEAGRGYFINTTGGAITVTLPSATAKPGDTIQLKDYARTWGTNNVNISSTTLDGATNNPSFSTNGQTVTLVYMDNTQGWSLINEDSTSDLSPSLFIIATGGTITTSGDFKIHTFTGDGCFVVSSLGNAPTNPSGGPVNVDYLVVAGGGSGGSGGGNGGGGGAGGFRASSTTFTNTGPSSPLTSGVSALPVSVQTYPISVGGGGAAVLYTTPGNSAPVRSGNPGSNSVFSTITSTGGGGGGAIRCGGTPGEAPGKTGGSGGGAGTWSNSLSNGGAGNTPPTSPSQGNNGGPSAPGSPESGGGGGGAMAVGGSGSCASSPTGGAGGGLPTAFGISGQSSGGFYYFAGGGGGSHPAGTPAQAGGIGGGGRAAQYLDIASAVAGTANTGGGGGAGINSPSSVTGSSGAGGSGIVIIRYKFQ